MEKKNNNEMLSVQYVAPMTKAFEIKVRRPICDSYGNPAEAGGYGNFIGGNGEEDF